MPLSHLSGFYLTQPITNVVHLGTYGQILSTNWCKYLFFSSLLKNKVFWNVLFQITGWVIWDKLPNITEPTIKH